MLYKTLSNGNIHKGTRMRLLKHRCDFLNQIPKDTQEISLHRILSWLEGSLCLQEYFKIDFKIIRRCLKFEKYELKQVGGFFTS
ncbi:unnamed protein product [Moneuplotes crassus]|uniref:Uncharacterized protein n=1 Tax=Euplotes crassus TaxID=5936 RepID=A0AAD1Y3Z0_EUPCR|nr:unnamed protein product [Moneuplotes crassus]